jgi:hypothetical protein
MYFGMQSLMRTIVVAISQASLTRLVCICVWCDSVPHGMCIGCEHVVQLNPSILQVSTLNVASLAL